MKFCSCLIFIICSLEYIFCIALEEIRGIFATNIKSYINTAVTLPSNAEELISGAGSDARIIFESAKISEIPNLKKKYDLSDKIISQIQACKYSSGASGYSKIEESIGVRTGTVIEVIGAAFRDSDRVYFALIKTKTSGVLRVKLEEVCHENCHKTWIFFESCKTVCDFIDLPYTPQDINIITQYIKYHSSQSLLNYLEVFKKPNYQTYMTPENGIYSPDGKYVAYFTYFGDIAIGPTSDIDVVYQVPILELIDSGMRDYRDGDSSERNVQQIQESNGAAYSRRLIRQAYSSGDLVLRGQCYVVNDTIYVGRRGSDKPAAKVTNFTACIDYFDGNFQLINFIGNGANGEISKEDIVRRMFDGRRYGPYYLMVKNNGNIEIHQEYTDEIIWQSNTINKGVAPYNLKLTNDRYLILEDSNGLVLYKSGTIKEYYHLKKAYCQETGIHEITRGAVSIGCKEEQRWKILMTQETDTIEIFRCMVKNDSNEHYMVSLSPKCEDQTILGSLGFVYKNKVSGTIPLYRCKNSFEHLVSTNINCEGGEMEFIIGYVYPV